MFQFEAHKFNLKLTLILKPNARKKFKKSEKYWGPRRNGWAGAVSGGQGPYRVGRGSIGCSTTKSQIIGISKNLYKMLFWLVGPKKMV